MPDRVRTAGADNFRRLARARQTLRGFAYTGVFCLGIGVLVWSLSTEITLLEGIVVSFCIGWSINLAYVVLSRPAERLLGPYVAPVPVTAAGLATGLALGGLYVRGEATLFFANDYGTLSLGVFFAVVGFVMFGTRSRLAEAQAALARAEAEQQRQSELLALTELKLLQAQIEPHFLFNTLSNIAGLIRKDPDGAEKTLHNLTRLLRASLNRTRAEATTLAEELSIAEAYLDIHGIRMQDRLHFSIDADEDTLACQVPPLLVQPLVENAIRHGIDPLEQGGEVGVRARREDATLCITVSDNGHGMAVTGTRDTSGTGTGLRNVRERLRALYGDQARLTLADAAPHGVVATLRLPVHDSDP